MSRVSRMTSGTIRRLGGADIEYAAAILSAAFGPLPWDGSLRRQMALQPDGMLLAEVDGRPAGYDEPPRAEA